MAVSRKDLALRDEENRRLWERNRERSRVRPTPTQRGYGTRHKRIRAQVAERVALGMAKCARCGTWIIPGEPWDLGHDDQDRRVYTGPEHRRCNRATAARVKARSRVW